MSPQPGIDEHPPYRSGFCLPQFPKILSGGLEGFIELAETEPHHLRTQLASFVERRTRNHGDPDLSDEMLCELDIVCETEIRNVGHDVVRAFRSVALKSRLAENRDDEVALPLIFL